MADFENVLRRTLEGLTEKSIETRQQVYAKAFFAVEKQLLKINPRPSEKMITKQLLRLREAITVVEADFGNDIANISIDTSAQNARPSTLNQKTHAFVAALVPATEATDFLINVDDLYDRWTADYGERAAVAKLRWECLSFVCRHQVERALNFCTVLRRLSGF